MRLAAYSAATGVTSRVVEVLGALNESFESKRVSQGSLHLLPGREPAACGQCGERRTLEVRLRLPAGFLAIANANSLEAAVRGPLRASLDPRSARRRAAPRGASFQTSGPPGTASLFLDPWPDERGGRS